MKYAIATLTLTVWALCAGATPGAAPAAITQLLNRLDGENDQIRAAELDRQFKEQSLIGSRSRAYPSLNLSLVANDGDDGALGAASPGSWSSGASSPSDSLGTSPGGNISASDVTSNGWASQLSLGYFLFTGHAISEDIHRAQLSVESSRLSQSKVSLEKKAQLLQLLMEWQHLKKAEEPLAQAVALVGQVKSFAKNKADLLYDTGDRINLNEKDALLEYQKVRLEEGLSLVTAGLKSLLPGLEEATLASLPRFKVSYALPPAAEFGNIYDAHSLDHQMNKLSEESSLGYVKVARWNRPWIPMVYTSASYSYTGDYHGETADGGWSVSLTLNFPLFDGFYSQARLQQANISAEASNLKTQAERDKRLLYLRHQRMKALVAGTQYRHLSLQAQKMEYRYQDVLKKRRQGLTSPLEVSGAGLELAQAQLEAYDKLKEHQQALLNVAVELNQWNQVEINEDTKL